MREQKVDENAALKVVGEGAGHFQERSISGVAAGEEEGNSPQIFADERRLKINEPRINAKNANLIHLIRVHSRNSRRLFRC